MAGVTDGSIGVGIVRCPLEIAEHDQVVLPWTSQGRTRDGRAYENGCTAVFTVRDRRIRSVCEYIDTLYASTVFAANEEAGPTIGGV